MKTLKAEIVKKDLYPAGFSGDSDVYWKFYNGKMAFQQPAFRAFAVFRPDSLQLKNNVVEISGIRRILMLEKDDVIDSDGPNDTMTIHIDLTGADVSAALLQIPDFVFYRSQQDALAHLPDDYPGRWSNMHPSKTRSKKGPKMDCSDFLSKKVFDGEAHDTIGFQLPKASSNQNPYPNLGYTEEAKSHHISGSVEVSAVIDTNGKPVDLWIIHPLGYGLDGEAAKLLLQMRFTPATCHGTPVAFKLESDTNFNMP